METAQDYIRFFEKIPTDKWCVHYFVSPDKPNTHCALGHLGERLDDPAPKGDGGFYRKDAWTLKRIFWSVSLNIRDVNDGTFGNAKFGKTPKERVLYVLNNIVKTGT